MDGLPLGRRGDEQIAADPAALARRIKDQNGVVSPDASRLASPLLRPRFGQQASISQGNTEEVTASQPLADAAAELPSLLRS